MEAKELTDDLVDVFRSEGVIRILKVISESEAGNFRYAAMRLLNKM